MVWFSGFWLLKVRDVVWVGVGVDVVMSVFIDVFFGIFV